MYTKPLLVPNHGSDRFRSNINEILKFVKNNTNKLPETKLLITKELMYVFEIETIGQDEASENVQGEDEIKSPVEDVIKVKDLDIFAFKDFEFMQKVPNHPLSFILKTYNKSTKDKYEAPQIEITCTTKE